MSHYALLQELSGLPNDSLDDDRYLVAFCHLISKFPNMISIILLPIHLQDHSACPTDPSDPNSPLTQAQLDDLMDTHDELYQRVLSLQKQYDEECAEVARLRSELLREECARTVPLGKDSVNALGCSSCSKGFSAAWQLKQHARVHWCSMTPWPCTYDMQSPSQAPIYSSFTVLSTMPAPLKLRNSCSHYGAHLTSPN